MRQNFKLSYSLYTFRLSNKMLSRSFRFERNGGHGHFFFTYFHTLCETSIKPKLGPSSSPESKFSFFCKDNERIRRRSLMRRTNSYNTLLYLHLYHVYDFIKKIIEIKLAFKRRLYATRLTLLVFCGKCFRHANLFEQI